jgi:hypothetical protein
LHFTIVDGGITVSTPTFLAASPAEVMDGPKAGMRPLGALEDAGRALLASLDESQRAVAIIEEVAPTNIVRGVELAPDPLSPVGIAGSDLTPGQRDMLMDVIEFYTSAMADDIAAYDAPRYKRTASRTSPSPGPAGPSTARCPTSGCRDPAS